MNKLEFVGNHLVNIQTGEIIEHSYDIEESKGVPYKEKRFFTDTAVSPEDATHPDQIKDFLKCLVDMRGIKLVSNLVWIKKESDYNVLTLKQRPILTATQYKVLQKLIKQIVYKNIILCSRAELSEALGVKENKLMRKLNIVQDWVQIKKADKGYIKVLIAPIVAFKGRYSDMQTSIKTYYSEHQPTNINGLIIQPKPIAEWSEDTLVFLDNLKRHSKERWESGEARKMFGADIDYEDIEIS